MKRPYLSLTIRSDPKKLIHKSGNLGHLQFDTAICSGTLQVQLSAIAGCLVYLATTPYRLSTLRTGGCLRGAALGAGHGAGLDCLQRDWAWKANIRAIALPRFLHLLGLVSKGHQSKAAPKLETSLSQCFAPPEVGILVLLGLLCCCHWQFSLLSVKPRK